MTNHNTPPNPSADIETQSERIGTLCENLLAQTGIMKGAMRVEEGAERAALTNLEQILVAIKDGVLDPWQREQMSGGVQFSKDIQADAATPAGRIIITSEFSGDKAVLIEFGQDEGHNPYSKLSFTVRNSHYEPKYLHFEVVDTKDHRTYRLFSNISYDIKNRRIGKQTYT